MGEYRLLLKHSGDPAYRTLKGYQATGGYEGLKKALDMGREGVINELKASGLRGRGGAGFPAWIKWSGVSKEKPPHYVLCNADEGEPGTFKDKQLLEACPFLPIEGMTLAGFATHTQTGYIYIRGEFVDAARSVRKALDEAYAAGLLGKNILGSGFDFDIHIHMGAGAYECGEESALMSSIMGERGMPRLKAPHAPLPTVAGLFDKPTLINNVETYSSAAVILRDGGEWYATLGKNTKNSRGTKIFCVSGHVNKPGNYELELGSPLTELFDLAGGVKGGKLKACVPGGSSVPMLKADQCEGVILGYDEMMAAHTMLGSGGCIVMNEHTCIVTFTWRTAGFYADESCGKCTPCREGTRWLFKVLDRIVRGGGRPGDVELLLSICDQIEGRTFCALGDAAAMPIRAAIKAFPEEFEYYVEHGRSMVDTPESRAMRPSFAGKGA